MFFTRTNSLNHTILCTEAYICIYLSTVTHFLPNLKTARQKELQQLQNSWLPFVDPEICSTPVHSPQIISRKQHFWPKELREEIHRQLHSWSSFPAPGRPKSLDLEEDQTWPLALTCTSFCAWREHRKCNKPQNRDLWRIPENSKRGSASINTIKPYLTFSSIELSNKYS